MHWIEVTEIAVKPPFRSNFGLWILDCRFVVSLRSIYFY